MHTQVGSCPKCGAPIYSPTVWHGIFPPPPQHTCACVPQRTKTTTGTSTFDGYVMPPWEGTTGGIRTGS